MYDERVVFQNMVASHLDKLLTTNPGHKAFVDHFLGDSQLEYLSEIALPKIERTLDDGKEHSTLIAMPPVCYDISVMAVPMDQASGHYELQYGGFGKLCSRMITEHPAFTLQGCEILIVIVYGRYDTKCWANLAIIAPRTSDWPEATVIPIDLLSDSERAQTMNRY